MQYVSALDTRVLVLNKFFMALYVITARRAFSLLCKASAEVVSIDDDGRFNSYNFESWKDVSLYKASANLPEDGRNQWVRTFSFKIEVPKIIRLLVYDRLPVRTVKFNRKNIFARDGNRCQYCGRKFPTTELSLDHIVPRSRGGKSGWTNVVCACTNCNKRKGGRTPKEARLRLISKPIEPKYNPVLYLRLAPERYSSWKEFLDDAYWSVPLK